MTVGTALYNDQNPSKPRVELSGSWKGSAPKSGVDGTFTRIRQLTSGSGLTVSGERLEGWDSSLATWLFKIEHECRSKKCVVTYENIPEGLKRLVALATAVPEREGSRREKVNPGILGSIGRETVSGIDAAKESLHFVGELACVFLRLMRGRAKVPWADMWSVIAECGPAALPIVTLIAGLVGLILAFLGAQQLQQFGAVIYTSNLVGVAMLREMGAVMAGVIVAGRTGAAFAAQLGTMQVNEEIDALETFGFSPMDFLVVPRVLALILMMPLLCIYADLVGILGGTFVSWLALDISVPQFFTQLQSGVKLGDFWLGIVKSGIFGVLIAVAGCMRGINSGRSASAVGLAVTSAVVLGIVSIVVADGIFALMSQIIGI